MSITSRNAGTAFKTASNKIDRPILEDPYKDYI